MANMTDPLVKNIRRPNPQNLVEKIVRTKNLQELFLEGTAETLVDKAMELDHLGGNQKPTPFLSLILKMLQMKPEKEIFVEFIKKR